MPIRNPRRNTAGFTLVEVLTVVAIIGVVASLGMLYMDSGTRGRSVQGFAEDFASQYSVARQRALATQKRQRLIVESDGFAHWESVQTGLAEPLDPNDWSLVFSTATPRGVTIAASDATLHLDPEQGVPAEGTGIPVQIDILPDGRARSVGTTFFETGWTIFIGDDKTRARVLLFGITGASSYYDNW